MTNMIWVIKDSKNNFAHANSINLKNSVITYVSFKTFSEECRGYIDSVSVIKALSKLNSMSKKVGFSEKFRMEIQDIDNLIEAHSLFKDEKNIVIFEAPMKRKLIQSKYYLSS